MAAGLLEARPAAIPKRSSISGSRVRILPGALSHPRSAVVLGLLADILMERVVERICRCGSNVPSCLGNPPGT